MSKIESFLWGADFLIAAIAYLVGGVYPGLLCLLIGASLILYAFLKKEESTPDKKPHRRLVDAHNQPYVSTKGKVRKVGLVISIAVVVVIVIYLAISRSPAKQVSSAPSPTYILQQTPGSPPFAIFLESVQETFQRAIGPTSDWWIVDKKRETACAVRLLMYIRVVNLQPFPVGISRFDVELKRLHSNEFVRIPIIGFSEDSELYTSADLKSAFFYRNRDFLRTELGAGLLQPHMPIRGWVPLDFPIGANTFEGLGEDFRISVTDSSGTRFSAYPAPLLADEGGLLMIPGGGKFEDLSYLKVQQPCWTDEVW